FFFYSFRYMQIRSGPLTGVTVQVEDIDNWMPDNYLSEAPPTLHTTVRTELQDTNGFGFRGKSIWHFVVVVVFLVSFGIVLFCFFDCLRRKDLSVTRKISWLALLCLGVFSFTFNWTDGSINFKWFSWLYPFIGFSRQLSAGPYLFSFSFPVFMIYYLDLRFHLTEVYIPEECSRESDVKAADE
ncbi:MAG: hypothetical protein GY765_02530, partial [bacterium]|nr:hypothetical protein [bacterium]